LPVFVREFQSLVRAITADKTMKQPESLQLVAEFHKTFHHPIQAQPVIPEAKRCELRVALIAEELKELEVAIKENDIVGVADALADIQYVLSGAILEFGLGEKFKDLFEEVQRSNMSKACATEEEARLTVEHYRKKDGTECYYKEAAGKWLVYRTADNKTIKSINYSPANLQAIVFGSATHKTPVETQHQGLAAG
jgi:predicted HAD superfamily Cof-like phosphohydrolase